MLLINARQSPSDVGSIQMKFDLKTFRSTYCDSHAAVRLRRANGSQHWMGHKSLETTMRYLAPAVNVQDQVDLVALPGITASRTQKKSSEARSGLNRQSEKYSVLIWSCARCQGLCQGATRQSFDADRKSR